jgi:hypothetical protein
MAIDPASIKANGRTSISVANRDSMDLDPLRWGQYTDVRARQICLPISGEAVRDGNGK